MNKPIVLIILAGCMIGIISCNKSQSLTKVVPVLAAQDSTSGGLTTSLDISTNAFGDQFTNITPANLISFNAGNLVFNQNFDSSASHSHNGLGPVFNNISCVSCHNQNGRGAPPVAGELFHTLVFRISIPGTDAHGGPLPVPGFGLQLQDQAIAGSIAEGQMGITYTEQPGQFADGEAFSLRNPHYRVVNPYITLPQNLLISARMAPSIFGLGLLESVPQQQIQTLSQQELANNDGVHGKPNLVWDDLLQKKVLGRYGWKANQTSVIQQTADALNGDIGITSSYFPNESSSGQKQAIPAHAPEISDADLNSLTKYVETLAPPARRSQANVQVRLGYTLFVQSKCNSCHALTLTTGTLAGIPELSNQTIRPYTDMLLHNMGPGLADQRPDFDAQGADWRTAPLWGIGLNQIVNGNTFFLHDGRARSLTEAILWHDGEAAGSKATFIAMSKLNRTAILTFLNSL